MKKLSWITHPEYDIALPKNHKFTASKFSDLFKYLQIKDFLSFEQTLIENWIFELLHLKNAFIENIITSFIQKFLHIEYIFLFLHLLYSKYPLK